MPASLLEVLRTIPDHRRDEGKRFDLATVLLYAILSMVAGANSYRQMHEFIRIHLQRLNEAFGLRLGCSPSYTGLRLIIQGVDPTALEAAFRQHALSISTPPPSDGLTAIAVDGKTLRGSFDAFSDRKATHMMSALRQADQIVLGHLMVEEKSNEIPAAPELIEALGLKGCVFTLDAEHAQKNVRARDRLGQSSAHPGQGQPTESAPQA
jgi:DDE_Tnp_1-associated